MNFLTLAGNAQLKRQLSALFDAGRMPHALIIEGAAGSGKATLAGILAQAMVCRDKEKPCGECLPCQKAAGNFHPDIITITGGKGARSFHIDEVRSMRSDAYLKPNESDVKVYILKNVQNMSEGAQNAILKILEEPPSYVFFILTCESGASLLPTILSRAPVFAMGAVEEAEALTILREHFPERDEEELRRAALLSGGNVGKMLEGLGDGLYAEAAALAEKMARAVVAEKEMEMLSLSADFLGDKEKMRLVLGALLLIFRDGCMCRNNYREILAGHSSLDLLRSRLTQAQLLAMIEIVDQARLSLDRGANQTLLSTWFPAMLRQQVESKDTLAEIKWREMGG